MKLNQGKKALERQKRWEEDQKMLNENNFFDGFGRYDFCLFNAGQHDS